MIRKIRIASGSTFDEANSELQGIFGDIEVSDVKTDEINESVLRMRTAMMTSHILDTCRDQCIAVLDKSTISSTAPLTNIAIAETLKELKTGHQSVMAELQQTIVGLASTSDQQAAELVSLKHVVLQQSIEKDELARQLTDGRRQFDVEIYELLTQLQEAQQKLGEAHRFIAKYSAPSGATTDTDTAATAPAPPSTFAGGRECISPVTSIHKMRQKGGTSRSTSPPKSLRSLVARPSAALDDSLVASGRIMAAGMSRMNAKPTGKYKNNNNSSSNNNNNNNINKSSSKSDDISSNTGGEESQPFPADVSMVSVRLDASRSYGTDFDRAWLFQFRAEVQQSLDVSNLELQDMSVLSSASSSCRPGAGGARAGGMMMSAKDCLAVVRRLYDFHKDSQPAVRARVSCSCSVEQRLYLLMERRYGLRALAVQQASQFLQAMEVYTESCAGLADLDTPSQPQQEQQQQQQQQQQQHQQQQLSLSSSASTASIATFSAATTTASGAVCDLNELAVFLAAFRNEVEEDFFPRTQSALVRAVRDLVLVVQRQRLTIHKSRPRSSTSGSNSTSATAAVAGEPRDDLTLSVREWRDHVLRFLYRDDDAKRVLALVRQRSTAAPAAFAVHLDGPSMANASVDPVLSPFVKRLLDTSAIPSPPSGASHSSPTAGPQRSCSSPAKLAWEHKMQQVAASESARVALVDFLRVLLDYQLAQHRTFLSSIHRAFVACDDDGDGLLGAAELVRCFDMLLQSPSAHGASSSLQGTVDREADAALLVDATCNNNRCDNSPDINLDSPLHRRQQYLKQRAQLRARQKQAAVVAAKNRLREQFAKTVSLAVPLDDQARVNYTTICKCITTLFSS